MDLNFLIEPFRFRAFEPQRTMTERIERRVRVNLQRAVMFIEAYWVVADLSRELEPNPPGIDVEIRQVRREDYDLLAVRKESEVREHFEHGDLGFVALHQGKVAYLRWVLRRPVPESALGILITPKPDEGYLFDAYAYPAFRGHGLHEAVTGYAMKRLREQGCRTVTGVVLSNNWPARKVLARLGFTVRDKFTLIRFAGRRRLSRRPSDDVLAPGN